MAATGAATSLTANISAYAPSVFSPASGPPTTSSASPVVRILIPATISPTATAPAMAGPPTFDEVFESLTYCFGSTAKMLDWPAESSSVNPSPERADGVKSSWRTEMGRA